MENANVYYSINKDYDNIKDEDLIEIIKSGDKLAFDYLINKYKELVNMLMHLNERKKYNATNTEKNPNNGKKNSKSTWKSETFF